jgi:ribosomal protein L5
VTSNTKIVDVGGDELSKITGQRAVDPGEEVDRAVQGAPGAAIGSMVTLRSAQMYDFSTA